MSRTDSHRLRPQQTDQDGGVRPRFAALLSASIAMLLLDLRTFQRYWVDDLTTQADIMASVTAPALAFNDAKTAQQQLAVLRVRPQILAGAVYASQRRAFRHLRQGRHDAGLAGPPQQPAGYRIERGELEVWHNGSSRTANTRHRLPALALRPGRPPAQLRPRSSAA
jgi:hypothetical protein